MSPEEHLEALLRNMTSQERQELERRMEERRNPFAFASPDACIIAFFSPGFSEDLSSWKLILSTSGILVQDISISRSPGYKRQALREERPVGVEHVFQILNRANELDFWNLNIISDFIIEDIPSYRLIIRHGEKYRDYCPHAVQYHAHNGDKSALRFVELWNLIHTHAPFPERES